MWVRRVLELDFDELATWFDKHKMERPLRSLFPKVGFIVDGIAAGFLYFTDSTVGIIDCYISNPDSRSEDRNEALDLITDELIDFAKRHGCKMIKCDTKLGVIKNRAISHGFKGLGAHESFSMEL